MAGKLKTAFADVGNFQFRDASALDLCLQIAKDFGLRPKDLAQEYDNYASIASFTGFDVSQGDLAAFKAHLSKQKNTNKANTTPKPAVKISAVAWDDIPLDAQPASKRQATASNHVGSANAGTPPPVKAAPTPNASTPLTTPVFTSRANKRHVVSTLNGNIPAMQSKGSRGRPRCSLKVVGQSQENERPYFMMDTVDAKIHAIDQRIMDFAAAMKQQYPQEAEDIDKQSVAEVAQEPTWVAGRIVADADGQLSEQFVRLEGSREASDGARVRLDLSQLPSYRLFSGQVVCVQGVNPNQDTFVARQLCTHLPVPSYDSSRAASSSSTGGSGTSTSTTVPASSTPADNDGPAHTTTDHAAASNSHSVSASTATAGTAAAGLSMVVAAGPFSTAENLGYEPLTELLQYCTEVQPDLLLLLGPFVDSEHPLIRSCATDKTFKQVFEEEVLARLHAWQRRQQQQGGCCQIVLLPAVRDMHHKPVFPQPGLPLQGSLLGAGHQAGDQQQQQQQELEGLPITSFPNPCSFVANSSLLVSALSEDVLKHLCAMEIAAGSQSMDKLSALASHIVGQRSFYPLYPAQLGACLDTSKYSLLQLQYTPELLVLPSDLNPFAKMVPTAPVRIAAAAAARPADAAASPGPAVADGPADATASPGPATAALSQDAPRKLHLGGTQDTSEAGRPKVPTGFIALNPGRLTRGNSGGTFAHVTIQPGTGAVLQRCRVDIIRI